MIRLPPLTTTMRLVRIWSQMTSNVQILMIAPSSPSMNDGPEAHLPARGKVMPETPGSESALFSPYARVCYRVRPKGGAATPATPARALFKTAKDAGPCDAGHRTTEKCLSGMNLAPSGCPSDEHTLPGPGKLPQSAPSLCLMLTVPYGRG